MNSVGATLHGPWDGGFGVLTDSKSGAEELQELGRAQA